MGMWNNVVCNAAAGVGAVSIVFGFGAEVQADTLFSQAPESLYNYFAGSGGPERYADSFTLAADSTVTGVQWWGIDPSGNGYANLTFEISIWTGDGNGVADDGLVAIESFASADVIQVPFVGGAEAFTATFTTPVALSGGVEYWVSIGVDASGDWAWLMQGPDSLDPLGDGVNDADAGSDGIWDGPFFFVLPERSLAFRICGEAGGGGNEPPIITCGDPAVLWSPNHELVDISVNLFTVTDADLDDTVTVTYTVVSEETEIPETGDGTGKHAPDFKEELADGSQGFFLRSERQGPGDGRVYLMIVTADDGTDSVTQVCVAAVVPHAQDDDSLALVLAEAAGRAADLQNAIDALGPGNVDLASLGLSEHGLSAEIGKNQ